MEGAAPKSVNYADTLPLAVSSTQNRRSYYPQNGQKFTDTGSNIIRIDVNANGLLDTQQSYLEFSLKDTSNRIRCLDQGHCWIKRLTIESAGVVLEDINNYNRLVSWWYLTACTRFRGLHRRDGASTIFECTNRW
eukprot:SAG11_NODE_845_length_6885_cov_6.782346_8_plen_135_part_00